MTGAGRYGRMVTEGRCCIKAVSPPFAPLRKSNMGGGGTWMWKNRLFAVLRFVVIFVITALLLTTKAC